MTPSESEGVNFCKRLTIKCVRCSGKNVYLSGMKCNRFRSAVTAAKDLASARSTDRVPASVTDRVPAAVTDRVPAAVTDRVPASVTDRVPAAAKGRGSALARHLGQGLADRPASWGNHGEYRLLAPGASNFFQVKSAAVAAME